MACDLIVPFRFGDSERDAVWKYVRRYYRETHPGLRLHVGRLPMKATWSKGRAIAEAIGRTREPILIIADADVIVSPEALGYSIIAVMHGAAWSMPHNEVYRLSRLATNNLLVKPGAPMPTHPLGRMLERPMHHAAPGGGIVVCTRSAYEVSGGIDPRFTGWGGEDISWARALDTLCGPCVRFEYPLYHLWHERQEIRPGNRASPENEWLAARYMVANGDVEAMRALVAEHSVFA